jgi:hypothetical protein
MDFELSLELQQKGVMSAERFSLEVERRFVAEGRDASYISITAAFLDELDIDACDGKGLIGKSLFDKIENEAQEKNLLKEKSKTSRLF